MFIAALFGIAKPGNNSNGHQMMEKNVVYQCDGIFFSNKEKQNTDTCYDMYEPQKHYTKCEKPDTKDHILHGST